jgi:hypothetical protein
MHTEVVSTLKDWLGAVRTAASVIADDLTVLSRGPPSNRPDSSMVRAAGLFGIKFGVSK